jgi:hypothetical protein
MEKASFVLCFMPAYGLPTHRPVFVSIEEFTIPVIATPNSDKPDPTDKQTCSKINIDSTAKKRKAHFCGGINIYIKTKYTLTGDVS